MCVFVAASVGVFFCAVQMSTCKVLVFLFAFWCTLSTDECDDDLTSFFKSCSVGGITTACAQIYSLQQKVFQLVIIRRFELWCYMSCTPYRDFLFF